MPTVIRLDPQDALPTIHSRLELGEDESVILVVPRESRALNGPLPLKRLRRLAQREGKKVSVVSPDSSLRAAARREGLPAFSSLREWQRQEQATALQNTVSAPEPPSTRTPSLWMGTVWLGLFTAVALPLLGGLFFLPSASVILRPTTQTLSDTVTITATTRISGLDQASLQVPARPVEVQLEASGRAAVSETRPEPQGTAKGTVTFINRTLEVAVIPQGTRVGTATGIEFVTSQEVVLLPGVGTQAQAPIVARQSGSSGNAEALAIHRVLEGNLALKVSVVNESPTQGGSDQLVPLQAEGDKERLREQVLQKAKETAWEQLLRLKRPEESLFQESLLLKIIEEGFDSYPSPTSPEQGLRLKLSVRGLAVDENAVNRLMAAYLEANQKRSLRVTPGTLRTEALKVEGWGEDQVVFRLFAQAAMTPVLDEAQIKAAVAGKSAQEAATYLAERLELTEWPHVRLYPAWARRVAFLPWRVTVRVVGPGQA